MTRKIQVGSKPPADKVILAKQERAFSRMASAIGAYLETVGWRALVIGGTTIERDISPAKYRFRFVIGFTGGRVTPKEPK